MSDRHLVGRSPKMENYRTNNDIKGAKRKDYLASRKKFEDTFFKAIFGCGGVGDRVDAVVEAGQGKQVMVVGLQGVVGGANLLLLTAVVLPLTLSKGEEEEEGCKEQRQIGDERHLDVSGALAQWLSAVVGKLLWEDMTSQQANRCYPHHDNIGALTFFFDQA